MHISIVGSVGSGKTTLFRALAGHCAGGAANGTSLVTIDVPDERLDLLTKMFNPRKTVYSRIELADTVAIREGELKNETLDAKSLQQIRNSDALLVVLRHFDNGQPVNPVKEFKDIESEFILADMGQIEARLERIQKQNGNKAQGLLDQEQTLLKRCLAHLESAEPLSTLSLAEEEKKRLRGFLFLSPKPIMIVINCDEQNLPDADRIVATLKASLPGHSPVLAGCARLEAELASMEPHEQAEFMQEYSVKESIRGRIIQLARDTLGLISFVTVGDDECRAWPIQRGMNAQDAAGTIHTDFYQKFIRAETVSYDDFVRLGGFAGCKKAGVWRLEGKTYVVQDGDILSIRAGA
jgi:ribosome-binding ATPase